MVASIESLESRRFFAAGTSVIVQVAGTPNTDYIQLKQTATQLIVRVNATTTSYDLTWIIGSNNQNIPPQIGWIAGVVVRGGDSGDTIIADASVTLPTTLAGENGKDYIQGGSGNDYLFAGYLPLPGMPQSTVAGDQLYGGAGNDHLMGSGIGYDSLFGDAGNDTIYGNGYYQQIVGGDGDDVLSSNGIQCFYYGGTGNDTITGDKYDYIEGGADNDVITAGDSSNTILGGDGADKITSNGSFYADGADIDGGAGNDTITTGTAPDSIYGNLGDDVINAGGGADYISAGDGNDTIVMGGGPATVLGDGGNDSISGAGGGAIIWGLDGNDIMSAGSTADTFFGGSGNDTVTYAGRTNPVTVTLNDALSNDGEFNENDFIATDVENVTGGAGNDLLTGGMINNILSGGAGNDTIDGGGGSDTLYGNGGDDLIYGGFGDDALVGGNGQDTLVAVGGGDHDTAWGQAGEDSFWLDAAPNEQFDGTASESAAGHTHLIAQFKNTALRDPNNPDLPDPGCDPAKAAYSNLGFLSQSPLFSSFGPILNDINQQTLGDCYFLATVGAIVKNDPARIRDTVVDLGDHTYAVRFYNSDGNPEYVRVDDDIPLNASNGLPIFAGYGLQNSDWVMMLEKAFVVDTRGVNGAYEDVSGGFANDVFPLFHIQPQQWGHWNSAPSLSAVAAALQQGMSLTAATDSGSFTVGDHIVLSHVYTIISVDLANNTIQLRNPWGSDAGKQKGAWVYGLNDGYVTFNATEWSDNFNLVYGNYV